MADFTNIIPREIPTSWVFVFRILMVEHRVERRKGNRDVSMGRVS